jgi:hypothetical protein
MEGEVLVGGAEAGDEVVFECADCTFGGVSSVDVGRDELEVDLLVRHVGFEGGGGFVVESLELRFEASGAEEGVGPLVCSQNGRAFLVGHGLDMNEVAVVVVDYQHVAVAAGGGVEEAASEVGEGLACGAGEVGVDVVGFDGCWGG